MFLYTYYHVPLISGLFYMKETEMIITTNTMFNFNHAFLVGFLMIIRQTIAMEIQHKQNKVSLIHLYLYDKHNLGTCIWNKQNIGNISFFSLIFNLVQYTYFQFISLIWISDYFRKCIEIEFKINKRLLFFSESEYVWYLSTISSYN